MKKTLIVKTSSLGDVIHALPVVSDIHANFPGAHIDWVAEELYAPLVAMHPAVRRAIPVAVRRWRRRLHRGSTWREMGAFRRGLCAESYDVVIDAQGLLKSAIIARMAHGTHHGFDSATAREPLASKFYDVAHHVERAQHAVTRNRLLVATALGYRAGDAVDYGIAAARGEKMRGDYAMLLHGTARDEKLWAEHHWITLGKQLASHGLRCVLPSGSDEERRRGERLARGIVDAEMPPRMPLDEMAALIAGAKLVVGVDTGLAHLAAALSVPVVAIFCGSNPELNGVFGSSRARNLGARGAPPAPADVLRSLEEMGAMR